MHGRNYKVIRRVENQRLAYYLIPADAGFWDQHWRNHFSSKIYAKAERGSLGWFEKPFTRYLPRKGRILEAGCGLGHYVLALRVRGYDVEGVDWGAETVNAVHTLYPDLPIRVGDVSNLEVPDCSYRGYISLGVVEHRREGPEPFLKEASRVLEPTGIALFSVPYFHLLRQFKARMGLYRGQPDRLQFYQYAFTQTEFTSLLQTTGFKIIDQMAYASFKGIKDEIPFLRRVSQWQVIGRVFGSLLARWSFLEKHLGHMLLVVCQKK